MSAKRGWLVGGGLAVVAVSLSALWFFHDPFRSLKGHVVSDNTILYKADGRFYLAPRRVRTIFFKDLTIPNLYSGIKDTYSSKAGWTWRLRSMPTSFEATKPIPGEQEPEQVYATRTSEGTLELIETRVMSPAEVQVVKHSQGSDAFIMNPIAPSPHIRRDNPRLAYGG